MHTREDAEALSIAGLSKQYGETRVLHELNLTISRGSIHGLVGLNGSGKTTTIECLLGLQSFQSGSISVLGLPPTHLHKARGKIVSVFDSPSLHPNLTVRQNLELARLLCEKPVRSSNDVEQLLGIDRYSNYKVKQLSLGNKRRTSIAHALLGQPELVLMDEPFNGLDAEGVDDVLQLIQRLNREEGTSFFLCSHQLPYLEHICSHIAVLHRGSISASGTIDSLLGGSKNLILLKTEQADQARALVDSMSDATYLDTDSAGYLRIELGATSSAVLNQRLVEKHIAVTELLLQRASLAGLFREITSEVAP